MPKPAKKAKTAKKDVALLEDTLEKLPSSPTRATATPCSRCRRTRSGDVSGAFAAAKLL